MSGRTTPIRGSSPSGPRFGKRWSNERCRSSASVSAINFWRRRWGGEVGPAGTPEIGILEIDLTDAGRTSPIFEGLPATHSCLQWHSAEVLQTPPGGRILAASRDCAVQALGFADHAFSIQYHVEITGDTVREWGAVPAYEQALERAMGEGALAAFEADAAAHMADFNRNARRIYDNFMRIVRWRHVRAA